jgi:hypothetical protein
VKPVPNTDRSGQIHECWVNDKEEESEFEDDEEEEKEEGGKDVRVRRWRGRRREGGKSRRR